MATTKRKMHQYEPGSIEKWAKVRDPFSPDGLQGVGTSDIATATGHNRYKTPLDLWQEKVGLKEPFKGNAETERGKANEADTRARFAMENKDWCRVEYHETRYYISDEIPAYSTLDGEIIVTEDKDFTCLDPKSGRIVTMHLAKGMHGILEIKDPQPKNEETYNEWNAVPELYQYQMAGQLRVTGFDFNILKARITGDYAQNGEEYRAYGAFAEEFASEYREIEEVIPVFWDYIKNRQQPPVAIFDDSSMSLVEINPDVKVGSIWADLAAARIGVIRYASQFKGITFGENELQKAKKVRAELNRYKKTINDTRIAIGKLWDEPLLKFKEGMDGLIKIVDEVCIPVDKHIKDAEAALDKAKTERIQKAIETALLAPEHFEVAETIKAMGGIPFNDKWLNATKRMPEIEKEINDYIAKVSSDIAALENVSDDEQMHQSMLQEYYRTRSVNDALMAKDRIIAARKAAEEAEARKKAQAESARQRFEQWKKEHSAPQKKAEEKPLVIKEGWEKEEPAAEPEKKEISITLRFYHTDAAAFRDLMSYMKEHGFTYEMVR